ncbi:MAG: cytochrome c oxidase assembly protein [Actinomycetota bacterium]|nr:cytochrome c oxidase assembly protein [Actinomycetota bacterium]
MTAAGPPIGVLVAGLAVVGLGYAGLAVRQAREARGWNHWRTTSFLAGVVLLIIGVAPSGSGDFGDHMVGHLLIGMFAPLALVLAAPVTLILRTVSPAWGRRIIAALTSRPARVLTNPVLLLALNVGGLAALYFTPLYRISMASVVVHDLVHLHFFVVGYLFAWMIAGPDPGPHRPSVPVRLVLLGVAVAGHAIIAQLLHAGLFVEASLSAAELRDGGTLMYYWGDVAEILLALAMLLTWTPRPRRPARGADASASVR